MYPEETLMYLEETLVEETLICIVKRCSLLCFAIPVISLHVLVIVFEFWIID